MLLNGTHLLPDGTGALIWPREGIAVVSDPLDLIPERERAAAAPAVMRLLAALIRRRRPRRVIWLGDTLPALLSGETVRGIEARQLAPLLGGLDWTPLGDEPLALGPLGVRRDAAPDPGAGEIAARPAPLAYLAAPGGGRRAVPCYATDGRRLLLPPFGPLAVGCDLLAPQMRPLFRRPPTALALTGGSGLRTLTRARLEAEARAAENRD